MAPYGAGHGAGPVKKLCGADGGFTFPLSDLTALTYGFGR